MLPKKISIRENQIDTSVCVSVVGRYSESQLNYCISTLFMQEGCCFDIVFSCFSSEEQIGKAIQRIKKQKSRFIGNVSVNLQISNSLKDDVDFIWGLKKKKMVLLANGSALYSVDSLSGTVRIHSGGHTFCQSILYNSEDQYIGQYNANENDGYLKWYKENCGVLQSVVFDTECIESKKSFYSLLSCSEELKNRQMIQYPLAKIYAKKEDCIKDREPQKTLGLYRFFTLSQKEACIYSRASGYTLKEAGTACLYSPEFFEYQKETTIQITAPSIKACRLENAYVVPNSDLVITKNLIISEVFSRDRKNIEDIHIPELVYKGKYSVCIMGQFDNVQNEHLIDLTGFGADNLYHLMFQIIAKLFYLDKYQEFNDYGIIMDSVIQRVPQFLKLVRYCTNRRILFAKDNAFIKCRDLVVVSSLNLGGINPVVITKQQMQASFVQPEILYEFRRRLDRLCMPSKKRKLFISRRNTNNSRIENEKQIEELFTQNGFEVLIPEMLSIEEQIKAFSEAGCIVGASGAAFSNIVFCHPGTLICCIKPLETEFYAYSTIAKNLGLRTLFARSQYKEKSVYQADGTRYAEPEYMRRFVFEINRRMKEYDNSK